MRLLLYLALLGILLHRNNGICFYVIYLKSIFFRLCHSLIPPLFFGILPQELFLQLKPQAPIQQHIQLQQPPTRQQIRVGASARTLTHT